MDKLVSAGYVNQDKEKLYYRMKDIAGGDTAIDWSLVVSASKEWMRQKFPEAVEEYADGADTYIHPFSGEKKQISPTGEKPGKIEKGGLSNV
jgi:hypothetical protein